MTYVSNHTADIASKARQRAQLDAEYKAYIKQRRTVTVAPDYPATPALKAVKRPAPAAIRRRKSMIDLKTLAMQENRHLIMESTGFTAQGGAELRRLAMRYLVLRECGVTLEPLPDAEWLFNDHLDTATDKLIQEMLK